MKFKSIILSIFFVFILIVFFIVRGNLFRYNDISFFIKEPTSNNLQIDGKWVLEDVKDFGNTESKFESEDFKYAYISDNYVRFGRYYTEFPKFKFRYLNLDKYLTSKGIVDSDNKEKTNNEKIIVTVDDGDFFYQEFIKIDENHLVIIFDKKYFNYRLESKTFEKENIQNENVQTKIGENLKVNEMDTSFLIGFKNKDNSQYSTILFRKEFENNPVVKKTKGIFVNKNNYFFLVDNILNNSGNQKGIYITSDYLRIDKNKVLNTTGVLNYVGENYINLEVVDKNNGQKKYELYSNESFNKDKKISIVQLAGESGKVSYYDSLRKIKDFSLDNFYEDTDNIGVYRKNYGWSFKSVFNNNSNDKLTSTEFDLDIIPLLPVFEIYSNRIPTNLIKNKVPDFLDYFVSPSENLVCILNNRNLYIYEIEDKHLGINPIATIQIPDKSEIIMSQWKVNDSSVITFNEFSKITSEEIAYR